MKRLSCFLRFFLLFLISRILLFSEKFVVTWEEAPSSASPHPLVSISANQNNDHDSTNSKRNHSSQPKRIHRIYEEWIDVTKPLSPPRIEFFETKPPCNNLQKGTIDVTLTTQLSLNRMWIMKHQCQRWPAPHVISIAIYIPPSTSAIDNRTTTSRSSIEKSVMDELHTKLQCDLSRMTITFYHGHVNMMGYPINALRNAALEGVTSSHAIYLDSDFLISNNDLHHHVQASAKFLMNRNQSNDTNDDAVDGQRRSQEKKKNSLLVIPAFEYLSVCPDDATESQMRDCLKEEWNQGHVPSTQDDIVPWMSRRREQVRPRIKVGYQNGNGKNLFHGSTLYQSWQLSKDDDDAKPVPIPCLSSKTYEPYLAFPMCQDLPKFPEVFRGWGWNKIIWIRLLLTKLNDEFDLWQIPQGFVIHLPHPPTTFRQQSKAGKRATANNTINYIPQEPMTKYLEWFSTYNHTNGTSSTTNKIPPCDKWKKRTGRTQQTITGYEKPHQ